MIHRKRFLVSTLTECPAGLLKTVREKKSKGTIWAPSFPKRAEPYVLTLAESRTVLPEMN